MKAGPKGDLVGLTIGEEVGENQFEEKCEKDKTESQTEPTAGERSSCWLPSGMLFL